MTEHDSSRAPGYERRDIPARLPLRIIVFMIVFVPVGLLIVWAMMAALWPVVEDPESPFGAPTTNMQAPRLQQDPSSDYAAFSQDIERRLNGVGWVDRDAGTVHLPIEHAKQLLVERGLPERTEPPPHSRIPLDPRAATRWLEPGPAAEPVIPKDVAPIDVLPPIPLRQVPEESQ